MALSFGTPVFNVLRGGLIGTAEVVPGISGGTVALIIGVYERLITSAGHVVSGIRMAAADAPRGRGLGRALGEVRRADWATVFGGLTGMLAAGLVAAQVLAPLIIGVYERLITSAGHVVSGIRMAAADAPRGRGLGRALGEVRRADWATVFAVLIGMLAAALVAAKVLAPLIEQEQQRAYGLFFGLVLASLWVPYSSGGQRWRAWHYLLAAATGVLAFVATGLPPAHVEPSLPVVMGAAALAVSALVMPGMSGSFILLTLGLYTTTMDALNGRDFGYIGAFLLGALIGGALFVKLLQWLLEH